MFGLVLLAPACVDEPTVTTTRDTESQWATKGYPAVADCVACHGATPTPGSFPAPPFLVGATPDDVRVTLLSFTPPVVRLDEPTNSPLLTKGAHSGDALTPEAAADILAWLAEEAP
jgi:mono/diheme cytochrome c family protein